MKHPNEHAYDFYRQNHHVHSFLVPFDNLTCFAKIPLWWNVFGSTRWENDLKSFSPGSEYVTASPDPALLAIRKVFWCRKTFPRSSFLSVVVLAKTFLFWDTFFTAEYIPLLIPILTFDFIELFSWCLAEKHQLSSHLPTTSIEAAHGSMDTIVILVTWGLL